MKQKLLFFVKFALFIILFILLVGFFVKYLFILTSKNVWSEGCIFSALFSFVEVLLNSHKLGTEQ